MRHGDASYQATSLSHTDSLIPLTKEGRLEAEYIAQWLATHYSEVIKANALDIYVSPFLRAKQTCDIVIDTLAAHCSLAINSATELAFITPCGDAQQAQDFIDGLLSDRHYQKKAILLVSHMPFVSYLVGQLTQSENMPIFATGAIAQIDYDPKLMQGQLLDMVTPEKQPT